MGLEASMHVRMLLVKRQLENPEHPISEFVRKFKDSFYE